MDELQRNAVAMWHRWQQMSVGQRMLATTVLLAGAIGLTSLAIRSSQDRQPICGGREFTDSELSAIQSAWRKNGLHDFRRDGSRLRVPVAKRTQYETAMPKASHAVPADVSEWEKQLAKANIFTTSEQLEQLKENALRNEVRRHLKAIPDIAEAEVIWARSKNRSAFSSRSKVTATISVTPRDGFRITPALADSLRTAVAGMVPDLQAADIAVLDQSTGLTIAGISDHDVAEQQQQRQQEQRARHLESQIAAALARIPGVSVNVAFVTRTTSPKTRFAAKPVVDGLVAEDLTKEAPIRWVEFLQTDQEFGKLVDFSRASSPEGDSDTNTAPPHSAAERTLCRIEIRIPQSYLESTVAQEPLTPRESSRASGHVASQDSVLEREQIRIRKLVAQVLPTDLSDAEITVTALEEPKPLANVVQKSSLFGWPQAVLALFGLLCATLALRTKLTSFRRGNSFAAESRTELTAPLTAASTPSESTLSTSRMESEQTRTGATEGSVQNPMCANHDLDRLMKIDACELAAALHQESPQVIAVLMSRLTPRLASACLARLTQTIQADVIRRLKSLADVPEEIVVEIARTVLQRIQSEASAIEGAPVNRVAHLLPETPRARTLA
jgi:hypothetical protein